jgi:hypothetical protein
MYLISYERQDTMFKLSLGLRIFLKPLLLVLFLILVAPIFTSLARLSRWAGYFVTEPFIPAITLYFTDAWHPGIINLKYMSELLGIPVVTHGLWHAGSYDPQDFLGRLVGNKPWVRNAEKSFFSAFDHNYFATEFHIEMFNRELLNNGHTVENPWYEEELKEILSASILSLYVQGGLWSI